MLIIYFVRFIHEKIKFQILSTPELGFNGADWYFINISGPNVMKFMKM
jgi:hypothetical protein